jgi:cell division transport system permease protein
MALRLDYLARETGQNLIRNWLLSLATVLIVTVSLTLLGITVLVGIHGLDNAFKRWDGEVSFIVYMQSTATADQIAAIEKELKASPQVDTVVYFDQEESYALYQRIFKDDAASIGDILKPGDLPTSFRVKPTNPDAEIVKQLANTFRPKEAVYDVDFPDEAVRQLQSAGKQLRSWLFVGVTALLAASIILIFITIQTAVFSRRREIEVMRLVGATNWFIRVPFIVEGVIQGLIGGLTASGITLILAKAWQSAGKSMGDSLLSRFIWEPSQLNWTLLWLVLLGSVVGAIGSTFSVTWYLRG